MFDTMTMTKVVGGFCGSLLVFLLVAWAGENLYHTGGGYGDHATQAYVIETGEDHGATEEVAAGPEFSEVYATASADAGAKLIRACQACHKFEDGVNSTGPSLYGVVGREVDAVDGFKYSGALEEVVDVWSPENLNHFLADPKGFAPGTKMSYKGMRDIEDRANLIAYLDSLDG